MKLGYLWRVIMRSSILRKREREREGEVLKVRLNIGWKIKYCVSDLFFLTSCGFYFSGYFSIIY